MNDSNGRRLAWQLFFLIVFFTYVNCFMITQYGRLLTNPDTGLQEEYNPWKNNPLYDPWQDDPWNWNPSDHKFTILESYSVMLAMMYGFLRLVNIVRICLEDDKETVWEDFWRLSEVF